MTTYLMYTKENCPYCAKAKKLFEMYQANVNIIEGIPEDWATFPAIYEKGAGGVRLIGGFNELVAYSRKNGL